MILTRSTLFTAVLLGTALCGGCHVDSFIDPSKSGYWERQPTTMPILTRIDVIERGSAPIVEFESPTPEDLIPGELSAAFGPGDFVKVEVYELLRPRDMWSQVLRVDQAGRIRLPEIGDIVVAGLTASEVEDIIRDEIRSYVLEPSVSVTPQETRAFQYTIFGIDGSGRQSNGIYNIQRPDFRLLDALAAAGGVPRATRSVFVIRHVPIGSELDPIYRKQPRTTPATSTPKAPVDVEDLINQLEGNKPNNAPVDIFPAMLDNPPAVDIDDLEPVRVSDRPTRPRASTPSEPTNRTTSSGDAFMYDPSTDRWVRTGNAVATPSVSPTGQPRPGAGLSASSDAATPPSAGAGPYRTRIIEIPYDRLANGDPNLNIIIRPGDYINVSTPEIGVVYIEGEVVRPGVYNLPVNRTTMSRIIAAAGGFTPIAIPERVDLVRMVGKDREAAITLDLGAIRHRTEPDIYLKPDDHIIVGTNFWAVPLAVIRSGFRATYGFGFLLDRNFGNDVFGAPPTNTLGQ